MSHLRQFKAFLEGETNAQRLAHIEELLNSSCDFFESLDRDLSVWRILSSYPTVPELVQIALHSSPTPSAGSSWAIASYFLGFSEQDIVSNTINSLTFAGRRAFGHRLLRLFQSGERPQRVLYCLARYAEEAIDRRFAEKLSRAMDADLSDAFLARSFNALFRLGVVDEAAINVAITLLSSHIDATNMDRKAAVSAIVYLCFAGNLGTIENLKSIQNKVTIPELRRLLNWGLHELNGFEQHGFNSRAAANFLRRANNLSEPNFTGFGCFSLENLKKGAEEFLRDVTPDNFCSATRTILALGHGSLIEKLAAHPEIGLAAITERKLGELRNLWNHFLPLHSKAYGQVVKNVAHADFWHERSPEVLFVTLESQDFLCKKKSSWQRLFESSLEGHTQRSLDILTAQILAYEKEENPPLADLIQENIKIFAKAKINEENWLSRLADVIHGTLTGSSVNPELRKAAAAACPPIGFHWSQLSQALTDREPFTSEQEKFDLSLFADAEKRLQDPDADPDSLLGWFCALILSTIQRGTRGGIAASHDFLKAIDSSATKAQLIFDAVTSVLDSAPGREPDDEEQNHDWGRHLLDRPLARWNAVLQVCLLKPLQPSEIQRYEQDLRDALRVAPHVEKRWVVCALVKLGADDAIKAILYQAIQHVDPWFVEHTIRQLLHSSHPRAQQALIRCVGRNTISDDLKLTILEEISEENPSELLQELKTLEILRLPPHIDDAIRDAVGHVAALVGDSDERKPDGSGNTKQFNSADIDAIIKGLLPHANLLSVDSRSALRTAEMILIQSQEWGDEAVDLSPIVNMHCKAVELTLRETFEAYTDAVVRQGTLARRLDVLGYARPIPEKMQIFEDYLAQLPIIKTIPYFSKFKLRKMLRAICLYRPGKRFTLDGPKAFALIFLAGSRKECPFGLAGTLPLGFSSDNDLFEFIKLVHSLQDSRNRAVHEGLTWEAQDEIDSMRSQAYRIIQISLKLSRELTQMQNTLASRSNGVVGA